MHGSKSGKERLDAADHSYEATFRTVAAVVAAVEGVSPAAAKRLSTVAVTAAHLLVAATRLLLPVAISAVTRLGSSSS